MYQILQSYIFRPLNNVDLIAAKSITSSFCVIFGVSVVVDSIFGLFISLPSRGSSAYNNFFFLQKWLLSVICLASTWIVELALSDVMLWLHKGFSHLMLSKDKPYLTLLLPSHSWRIKTWDSHNSKFHQDRHYLLFLFFNFFSPFVCSPSPWYFLIVFVFCGQFSSLLNIVIYI